MAVTKDQKNLVWVMADTTWRMAVPTVLLAGSGIFADLKFGTSPWLTFAGTIIGFAIAVKLVRMQLDRSRR